MAASPLLIVPKKLGPEYNVPKSNGYRGFGSSTKTVEVKKATQPPKKLEADLRGGKVDVFG